MIYEVVEVLSQRPPEDAPLFDATVAFFGWDPLPVAAPDKPEPEEEPVEKPVALAIAETPDTSKPRPRVRKPRPRQESEPRTVSLIRSA